jgi:predicted TIM-barrel fold metal-dependent hydrolase
MNAQEFAQKYFPQMWDPEGEQLLRKMDALGIDVTVMLVDDFGLRYGEPMASIEAQNKAFADLQRKHPQRLIACAGVDPRRRDATKIIRKCVEEWGMRGIKYHPDAGWDPNGRESYRLLERIEEWGIPVVTHTGFFFPPSYNKHVHPMLLDDVCSDFPDLKLIAAHSGRTLWWETVATMCQIHPNLHGDLAGWQTLAVRDYAKFARILRSFIDIAGADKILWGTDDPVYGVLIPTGQYIQAVRDLPTRAPDGLTFTDAEVSAILGGNAARLFGL